MRLLDCRNFTKGQVPNLLHTQTSPTTPRPMKALHKQLLESRNFFEEQLEFLLPTHPNIPHHTLPYDGFAEAAAGKQKLLEEQLEFPLPTHPNIPNHTLPYDGFAEAAAGKQKLLEEQFEFPLPTHQTFPTKTCPVMALQKQLLDSRNSKEEQLKQPAAHTPYIPNHTLPPNGAAVASAGQQKLHGNSNSCCPHTQTPATTPCLPMAQQ